jgi:predicted dinucleotide-utilizing enzyme
MRLRVVSAGAVGGIDAIAAARQDGLNAVADDGRSSLLNAMSVVRAIRSRKECLKV